MLSSQMKLKTNAKRWRKFIPMKNFIENSKTCLPSRSTKNIEKNALKNIKKKLSEFFLVIYEPSVMLSINEWLSL